MSQKSEPQIITIGLEPLAKEIVSNIAKGQAVLETIYDIEKLAEADPLPSVKTILCGPPPSGLYLDEIAQLLRQQYPAAAIFYLTTDRSGFIRKSYIKNGFTDAFLIPIDSPTFEQAFREALARSSDGKLKAFRAVKMIDIQPGQEMDFDTYIHLKSNNKHIKYSSKGDPIDPERVERLNQHKVGSLHIEAADVQKFYQFTAQQLRNLGNSEGVSQTEKRDRMQTAVRELISDLFQDSTSDQTFEAGKAVVQDCQEIVKAYIMSSVSGADNKWYEKLLALSQTENTAYTLAANVSTFAALFSMALGIGNPEHLAMAGLLHDIGLSEIPGDILAKPEAQRTPEEQESYKKHPKISVTLIQSRKMIVPELVLKIVGQHHERYDGTGYPDEISPPKLKPEAQILAIADELCYLTVGMDGKPPMTPVQAIQKIYDDIPSGEMGHKYDPELVRRLYQTFKAPPQA